MQTYTEFAAAGLHLQHGAVGARSFERRVGVRNVRNPAVAAVAKVRQLTAVGIRTYWPALIVSVLPAICLFWGIFSGRMPQRYGTFDRQSNAAGFWMMAVVWAGLLLLLLSLGLRL